MGNDFFVVARMMETGDKLNQLAGEKYISLESYKRAGDGVRTPVWFAVGDGVIYIYSLANAGKVKRIRNNPRVSIAPCTIGGRITGQWIEAEARIVEGDEDALGHELLRKKYGWSKRLGDFFSRLRKRERAVIAIRVK
ncbi:MAG: PPOX class F420-dependent oxidoreductase [Acidobacteriota bacterium]